jgi:hypothetical protein
VQVDAVALGDLDVRQSGGGEGVVEFVAGQGAGLGDPLFWGSLAVARLIAGGFAFPVNRWLLARGKGHAIVHEYHHAH